MLASRSVRCCEAEPRREVVELDVEKVYVGKADWNLKDLLG
jgi:hypothetical protein